MAIQPLNDRVLLKRLDSAEQSRSGIIIPDTAKEQSLEAKVVAIGAGRLDDDGHRHPPAVQVGNRVLIGKYSGTEVTVDGEDHLIVREDDIFGVIE